MPEGHEAPNAATVGQPPTADGGIMIDMSVPVYRMTDVNTKDKNFTVLFGIIMHWVDIRLTEVPELSDEQVNEIAWRPTYFITDCIDDPRIADEHFDVDRRTGHVLWYRRMRAVIEDDTFEMHDFPFDQNDLCLSVRIPRHEKQRIRGLRHGALQFLDKDFRAEVEKSYDMLEQEHEEYHVDKINRNVIRGPGAIAHFLELITIIEAYRKPHFWVNSIVLPNLMLSIFGLAVFLIDPVGNTSFYSDRINLLMTVVLTSVAFQFTVSAAVPTLSYMTCLDKWRNTMNVIFLFTFVECTIIQILVEFYPFETHDVWPIDRACLVISICFMCLSSYMYIFSYVGLFELVCGSWKANTEGARTHVCSVVELPLEDRALDDVANVLSPVPTALQRMRDYGSVEQAFGAEDSPLLPEAPATSVDEMSEWSIQNLTSMEQERKRLTEGLLAKEKFLFGKIQGARAE